MGILFSSHFEKTKLRSDVVQTVYGPIIGKRFKFENEKAVDAFLGIPFAKPPVGNLRFKKPEAPEFWQNTLPCLVHGPRAIQKGLIFEKLAPHVPSSEDCLYLNVFAPAWDLPADQPNGRAVMVFIHGGGFVVHSSANYGDQNICKYLCTKEVVVVTIQYRLGILGFGTTGDQHSVSNLGLWDQAFALKWVKNNIKNFNGDPENITIFGHSAGGASVDMLCLSPHTNCLFSKVIPMAGAASCPWAMRPIASIRNSLIEHAESFGWKKPANGSEEDVNRNLMEFLRQLPSSKLALGLDFPVTEKDPYSMHFVPVIDADFLPEPISELRKKVPKMLCMTGTCEYEGLLIAGLAKKEYGLKKKGSICSFFIPDWKYKNAESLRKEATALYFNDQQSKDESNRAYVKLLSDVFLNNGVYEFAHDMTLAGHNVYLYSFLYHNPKTFGIIRYVLPLQGSTHASEIPYLFGKNINGGCGSFTMNANDEKITEKFTTLFTNFAKYGDPNGIDQEKVWKPLTVDNTFKYLSISANEIVMKENYENRRAEFWRKVQSELQ